MAAAPQSETRNARSSGPKDRAVRQAQAQNFVRGLGSEFKRITWPSRPEWIAATLLTLALVIGVGLYTFGVDQLCTWLFSLVRR